MFHRLPLALICSIWPLSVHAQEASTPDAAQPADPAYLAADEPLEADEAPEGPPMRGAFIGFGGGFLIGNATDDDGRTQGSFSGGGGFLRFGEEMLPGFSIGLEIGSVGGSSDTYTAGVGGLMLQAGWRPFDDEAEALEFVFGHGLGGGSITPEEDNGPEGSNAGAMYMAGASWTMDFGGPLRSGWAWAPTARWYFVPPQMDSDTMLSAFTLGVGLHYYAGKGE